MAATGLSALHTVARPVLCLAFLPCAWHSCLPRLTLPHTPSNATSKRPDAAEGPPASRNLTAWVNGRAE